MRLVISLALCLLAGSAMASMPSTMRKSLSLRVGAAAWVGTFAQHSKSCEPIGGGTINTTKAPALGEIRTTEQQPVVAKFSISGACIGSHMLGTKVDYLAKAAGNDNFEFDVVFRNGTAHYIVTTTNR